ncbi:MAG TPA: hypothetical protein PKC63_04415 [Mariniflexile sp.]|nr:hypothetical protein [Mariniflexile sp.]
MGVTQGSGFTLYLFKTSLRVRSTKQSANIQFHPKFVFPNFKKDAASIPNAHAV